MTLRPKRWVGLIFLIALLTGCFRSPQQKSERYIARGKKALAAKQYPRAALEFRSAIQALRNNPEAYFQLGLAYLGSQDIGAAVAALRKATELNPKHRQAQITLSNILVASGQSEAVKDAQRRMRELLPAAAGSPDLPQMLTILGKAELAFGNPEAGIRFFTQALEKAPQHLEAAVLLAMVYMAKRDPAAAEAVLKRLTAALPRSPEAALELSRFYLAVNRPGEAEGELRRAVKLSPANGPLLLELATLQLRSGHKPQAEQTYQRLSELPEDAYKPLHAIFLLQQGQREAGVRELAALANKFPDNRPVRDQLIAVYLADRKYPEAQSLLALALKKNPRDTQALLQRAELYTRMAKFDAGIEDINTVLRYRSDSWEAHYALAKIHHARGDMRLYRQELAAVVRLAPSVLPARIELAQALRESHSAKAALDLLEEAPEAQKKSLALVAERNWALLALGEQDTVRSTLKQALAQARAPDLVLQEGFLKLQQHDLAGARAAFEEVLRAHPDDVRAVRFLAATHPGNPVAELGTVAGYASKQPGSAPLQYFYGQMLVAAGKREKARQAFTSALKADPNFATAGAALAQLDVNEGKLDAARQTLSGLAGATPTAEVSTWLGIIDQLRGRRSEALQEYRRAVDSDDTNVAALNNLAYLLADYANQPDQALKYAQRAKELAPSSAMVEDTLGWVYFRKGIYEAALSHLKTAVATQDNALRRCHLALAYLKAGDRRRGQQELEAALRLDPNLPEAKAAQQMFAAVRATGR